MVIIFGCLHNQAMHIVLTCSRHTRLLDEWHRNLVVRSLDLGHSLHRASDNSACGSTHSKSGAAVEFVEAADRFRLERITREIRGLFIRWLAKLYSRPSILHHVPYPSQYSDHFPFPWPPPFMQMTLSFFSFHPLNFDSSISHLQNALQQISSWMSANLLTLNSSMTEFLLIRLEKPTW